MRLSSVFSLACLALQSSGATVAHQLHGISITEHPDPIKRAKVQEVVTWDNQSLFVRGERIMIYSGEFHPYRLPVASLYSDVFQKIKALGFNCVSFYYDWALVEGKPGTYRADGIFDLQPFFDAASEAGIYLLARPGPYVNAESSGGGFPGWLARIKAMLRTNETEYIEATNLYLKSTSEIIAKAQITNGGPVILYQPENEYSEWINGQTFNPYYIRSIMDTARAAGIEVPFINNDAWAGGHDAPGSGVGAVNIYGHDSYPLGGCATPNEWPEGQLSTNFHQLHEEQSPSTPYSLVEFQAGYFDGWGGAGYDMCAALTNEEYGRVFYKNNLAAGVAIENHYMIFGGTNWGNLGYSGGYTSYDYGAAISESRNVTREKYSEFKLLANFLKVSPTYMDILVGSASTIAYASTTDLYVTPLTGQKTASSFYVVRHADYTSLASTNYTLKVSTSAGSLKIPQLGGFLTLNGRDSKIHVTDYPVGGSNILYSTAEVFTWKQYARSSVLVLYGGPNEHHEFAVSGTYKASVVEGSSSGITIESVNGAVVVAWDVSPTRRIVQIGDLLVLLLDRNSAYNYWTPEISTSSSIPYSSQRSTTNSLIITGGYLIRSSFVQGSGLYISGDFNGTTTVEVIGVPSGVRNLYINGAQYETNIDKIGFWSLSVEYKPPKIEIPNLKDLDWKYVDTLPEIQSSYDDSPWISADHMTSNNTVAPLQTPTSLYGQDYGFHTGYLLFRGHFVATGEETTFAVQTQGGAAYGHSVWLNGAFLGSWAGNATATNYLSTFTLPKLTMGQNYILTILIDNMGLEENWTIGFDQAKEPRGILNYILSGHSQSDVTWKLTGNLGGEDYADLTRGPLNEGGLYAERQGWHQPYPPVSGWQSSSPLEGLTTAGVGFYAASFDLDIPHGWDVPLFITFGNSTSSPENYRVQLYVNGYQYGKYVKLIGPQTSFPVPQGILNYQGTNWIAVTLWAQDSTGAKLDDFALLTNTPVLTALSNIAPAPQPKWTKRDGAY